MEEFPVFKGEPQEVDSYILDMAKLRHDLDVTNQNIEGFEKVIGESKGPHIGFEGTVDYDQLWIDEEIRKKELETKIRDYIRRKLGLEN